MFITLMNRNVTVVLLKVLINWYDKCAVFVCWNNLLSRCLYLMCGVRQEWCCLLSCFQFMLMIWYRSFVIQALDVMLVMFRSPLAEGEWIGLWTCSAHFVAVWYCC